MFGYQRAYVWVTAVIGSGIFWMKEESIVAGVMGANIAGSEKLIIYSKVMQYEAIDALTALPLILSK